MNGAQLVSVGFYTPSRSTDAADAPLHARWGGKQAAEQAVTLYTPVASGVRCREGALGFSARRGWQRLRFGRGASWCRVARDYFESTRFSARRQPSSEAQSETASVLGTQPRRQAAQNGLRGARSWCATLCERQRGRVGRAGAGGISSNGSAMRANI